MANTLYDAGREGYLGSAAVAHPHWLSSAIKFFLMSNVYTFNATGHRNLNDAGGGRVSGPIEIVNKTSANGAADGDDIRFNLVSGAQIIAILGYKDASGVEATSTLLLYIDTATGLPITPNGGDIIVSWDNGTNKIFRL